MATAAIPASFDALLGKDRLVPVIVNNDPDLAAGLASALVAGGMTLAEVTLRTPHALQVLSRMAEDDGLVVGAGSVTRALEVDAVVQAGGQFLVSPGFSAEIATRAQELAVPYLPGCSTATDIMSALRSGLRTVKFFPAEAMGGIRTLKALAAPFPGLRFVPTGGVGPHNYQDYLADPAVAGVGGSWMVPGPAIVARRWSEITELCREAVEGALGSEGARDARH